MTRVCSCCRSTYQRVFRNIYTLNMILLGYIASKFSTDAHEILKKSNVDYAFWREKILFSQVYAWIQKYLIMSWALTQLALILRPAQLEGSKEFLDVYMWIQPAMLITQQLSTYTLGIIATLSFFITHRAGKLGIVAVHNLQWLGSQDCSLLPLCSLIMCDLDAGKSDKIDPDSDVYKICGLRRVKISSFSRCNTNRKKLLNSVLLGSFQTVGRNVSTLLRSKRRKRACSTNSTKYYL